MATSPDAILTSIAGVLEASPFLLTRADTPFDFDTQPTGSIEACYRLTIEGDAVSSGLGAWEERTDRVDVWLARKFGADPTAMYQQLVTDAATIRTAVIAEGAFNGAEYTVPDDGAGMSIEHDAGKEYAVLRLTVPVNYEVSL